MCVCVCQVTRGLRPLKQLHTESTPTEGSSGQAGERERCVSVFVFRCLATEDGSLLFYFSAFYRRVIKPDVGWNKQKKLQGAAMVRKQD